MNFGEGTKAVLHFRPSVILVNGGNVEEQVLQSSLSLLMCVHNNRQNQISALFNERVSICSSVFFVFDYFQHFEAVDRITYGQLSVMDFIGIFFLNVGVLPDFPIARAWHNICVEGLFIKPM